MSAHKPVFYDPSRKRLHISYLSLGLGIFIILAASVVFVLTIASARVPDALKLNFEHPSSVPISHQVGKFNRTLTQIGNWLPRGKAVNARYNPVRAAFYVPWDDASFASLKHHYNDIDWLVVGSGTLSPTDQSLEILADRKLDAFLATQPKTPVKLLMVQNIANDQWDKDVLKKLIANPVRQQNLLNQIVMNAKKSSYSGVVFDFENLDTGDHGKYLQFLKTAKAFLNKNNIIVTITAPVADKSWDFKKYAAVSDKIFLMAYDENWVGGQAGPIASQDWFVKNINEIIGKIGAAKSIVAIGNYAYDWADNGKTADALSIEEAWLIAHDSSAKITFDPKSGNSNFSYQENGINHNVWLLDGVSAWNEMKAVKLENAYGMALWRLGSEDSNYWKAQNAIINNFLPQLNNLSTIGDVDVEGNGEVFYITDTPTNGLRNISFDKNQLVNNEEFVTLPTPFVVNRIPAANPKMLALTFDDGPDAKWTPKILDVLQNEGVNATFFVIGENALSHPNLLNRIISEGNEIGNHSYTHPNLARDNEQGTQIELNTTQRLVEAYTKHSMRLFRAPYFGDAEPTTPDELIPALNAQKLGYVNVGLHVDPNDWKTPGVDNIIKTTITEVEGATPDRTGQIILLHDSGGDREQTLKALPIIIKTLKAKGYQFVTMSEFLGKPKGFTMPKISGKDILAVNADVAIFITIAVLKALLLWLFAIAIFLGIVKALSMTALGLWQKVKVEKSTPPPIDEQEFVSVIIPAYNEEMVIKDAIERVLMTRNAKYEIIIANDGSKDNSAKIVTDNFGNNPLVTLLNLENGGKAVALNKAIKLAKGEIIIALDADTQFEPDTISKLVRWFKDEKVGAVAGNARVGNEVNLITRWQGIEYVVSQNIERRALANFDAITVVPGAVGAWRRKALEEVGLYPENTLAEDQDLTIAIQRKGWKVVYDDDAVAWTEAPETFKALSKQRFRWSYGTLQCLWKHRGIFFDNPKTRPDGLAFIGMTQAWVFQIFFALISPLIDLALLISIINTIIKVHQHGLMATHTDLVRMFVYWLCFVAIDVGGGFIAYSIETRKSKFPWFSMIIQKFAYRQIMYLVSIKAIFTAIAGLWAGWGQLERSGRVKLAK
jgi:cellulose synthase/poly-beta-1,6-N-acetylglucosamine synthase-like glycosyltransferase/peptidoglycan/xylan/chitin deacetylase (PgdA/CDA1 family)/spore germination protein YaaH